MIAAYRTSLLTSVDKAITPTATGAEYPVVADTFRMRGPLKLSQENMLYGVKCFSHIHKSVCFFIQFTWVREKELEAIQASVACFSKQRNWQLTHRPQNQISPCPPSLERALTRLYRAGLSATERSKVQRSKVIVQVYSIRQTSQFGWIVQKNVKKERIQLNLLELFNIPETLIGPQTFQRNIGRDKFLLWEMKNGQWTIMVLPNNLCCLQDCRCGMWLSLCRHWLLLRGNYQWQTVWLSGSLLRLLWRW